MALSNIFCSNTNCNSNVDQLFDAPPNASVYIGLPGETGPWKICSECLQKVESLKRQSIECLRKGVNVFSVPFETKNHDVVTLDQEDAEDESQKFMTGLMRPISEKEPEPTYFVSSPRFEKVLSDIMSRLNIEDQLNKCKNELAKEIDGLSSSFDVQEKQLESTHVEVTDLLKKYNAFASSTKPIEMGTVEIDDRAGIYEIKEAPNLSENLQSTGLKDLPGPVEEFLKTVSDELPHSQNTKKKTAKSKEIKVGSDPCSSLSLSCKNQPQPSLKDWLDTKRHVTSSLAFETSGSTFKITVPRECPMPKAFSYHRCSPVCCLKYNEEEFRLVSPLVIPFYLGWAREFSSNSSLAAYVTPCGKRITQYSDIHAYNRITKNGIPVEFFSLEASIDCLNEFKAARQLTFIKDISYGKEWTPVQCVNSINHELPTHVDYSVGRVLGEGVELHDEGFLTCCDCEDDCQDKEKCACWQLTLAGLSCKLKKGSRQVEGYSFRRLKDFVQSGIYECNQRCKCNTTTCFNRVVQGRVMWPVQVFRTSKKGWGVRALHDIPKGSFVCIYAGKVLNDSGANQEGLEFGDEYIADLDFIEIMESRKEGYEATCSYLEEKSNENGVTEKSPRSGKTKIEKPKLPLARKSTAGRNLNTPEEQLPHSTTSEVNVASNGAKEVAENSRRVSSQTKGPLGYREYFARENKESRGPYSIDGKRIGNIGRFFNHSCDPNLFIQTVFVDTHDLRLPWVAFFTKRDVKAGTELCWDYNYEVGSVEGKVLYCFCGAANCRSRLL